MKNICAFCVCVLGWAGVAGAAPYTFVKIADTGGSYSGFGLRPSVSDYGEVTFNGSLDAGGTGRSRSDGIATVLIGNDSGPLNGFGGAGSTNWGAVQPDGTVAFLASNDSTGPGIFKGSGGAATTVYDTSGP